MFVYRENTKAAKSGAGPGLGCSAPEIDTRAPRVEFCCGSLGETRVVGEETHKARGTAVKGATQTKDFGLEGGLEQLDHEATWCS